jgi:transcriptional regulator with XRE-family HTH domain
VEAENGTAFPLARRLRDLRGQQWPDVNLTQAKLARALNVAPTTLSSWESQSNPKAPPTARLRDYARFFATRRSLDGGAHLVPVDKLTEDERQLSKELEDELVGLHPSHQRHDVSIERRRELLSFKDAGSVVIICPMAPKDAVGPLAAEGHINYTRLHNYADLDALIELFGHIRALNPERAVLHRLSSDVHQSELQNHVILLGGIGWNSVTGRILAQVEKLPIEQVELDEFRTGDVFRIKQGIDRDQKVYLPVTSKINGRMELVEDLAFLARLRNPFNVSRTLTIFNGVHSRGVVGAVLALTDEALGPSNEEYLSRRFGDDEFAVLARVPIVSGRALAPDLQNPAMRLFEWSDS